jgi:hypothetical protein
MLLDLPAGVVAALLATVLVVLLWINWRTARTLSDVRQVLDALAEQRAASTQGQQDRGSAAGEQGARERLSEKLRQAETEAGHQRLLQTLTRRLLEEVLRTARQGVPSCEGVERAAEGRQRLEQAPAVANEDDPFAEDREHQVAARMARVMVADLLLYNPKVKEQAVTPEAARALLQRDYRAARQTFAARVAGRVLAEKDYLEVEFERALNRFAATESRADASQAMVPAEDGAHLHASRLARVMIAELLLDSWVAVEQGLRQDRDLTRVLVAPYQAARRAFEARVAETVWRETHYLDLQWEQLRVELRGKPLDDGTELALKLKLKEMGAGPGREV